MSFIICSYLSDTISTVRKNITKDAVMVCICIITHTIFFIIIAPVSHYRGTPRFTGENTNIENKASAARRRFFCAKKTWRELVAHAIITDDKIGSRYKSEAVGKG